MTSIESLIGRRGIEQVLAGEMSETQYRLLYAYFAPRMPYEVAKGDAYDWLFDAVYDLYNDAYEATRRDVL
jgi:hypothetical protein